MDRQRKKNLSRGRPGTTVRHGGSVQKMDDKTSRAMKKLGGALGNKGLDQVMAQQAGKRDDMLKFVVDRLKNIRDLQLAEARELKDQRDWHKAVFKGRQGFHMPDPGRWKEAAQHYKNVGEALCRGQLGRAKQLLERAVEAEQAAFDAVPKQVLDSLMSASSAPEGTPESGDNVSEQETAPGCEKPAELKMADRIIAMQPTLRNVTARPTRPMDWFRRDEEEEEEE
ncbi:MAG: hypothetical protein GY913_34280, partial [Proteobacteria bacterium]|nr:hypothetical protein [Pseudomonadota bacterium]